MIKITPKSRNKYEVCEDYPFKIDAQVMTIPKGFISDGASIPKAFWKIIGTPFSPSFIEAAIVHDFLISKQYNAKHSDQMFYDMLVYTGVSIVKARVMYIAIRLFRKYLKNKALSLTVVGLLLLVAVSTGIIPADKLILFLLW